MIEIVPAFLVESEKEFEKNLRAVEKNCRLIQVDVLDGSLFPNFPIEIYNTGNTVSDFAIGNIFLDNNIFYNSR